MSSLPEVTQLGHLWDSNPNQPDTKVPVLEAQETKKGHQVQSYQTERKGEKNDIPFTVQICDGPQPRVRPGADFL